MPLASTGNFGFDQNDPPNVIHFWMKVKDADPVEPVRIVVTAEALRHFEPLAANDQYDHPEIFRRHRASIEEAANDKFDRGEVEDGRYEGMTIVRVSSADL